MELQKLLLPLVGTILMAVSAKSQDNSSRLMNALIHCYALDTSWCVVTVVANHLRTPISSHQNISLKALSMKEPLGLFTVLATVIDGSDTVEQGQVRYRIDKFADAYTAIDRLPMRRDMRPEDFSLQRVNITTLTEKPITDLSSVIGKRLKRNLAKGTILTASAVESVPEVESGRDISLVYSSGLCRISATGVALQTGRIGDQIRVRNKSSGQVVVATVTNQSEVSIAP